MAQPAKFFIENSNLFTNPEGTAEEMEKYNLYNGLVALCNQIDGIEHKVSYLENLIININNRLK